MAEMSDDDKRKIIQALESSGARLPCPRCGNSHFTLLDGYFNQPLNAELGSIVIGGRTVPSVVLTCSRCGYLSQHALGALVPLPTPKPKEEQQK